MSAISREIQCVVDLICHDRHRPADRILARQRDVLAEMNAFNIEGRYPGSMVPPPDRVESERYMKSAEEVFQWLIQKL